MVWDSILNFWSSNLSKTTHFLVWGIQSLSSTDFFKPKLKPNCFSY